MIDDDDLYLDESDEEVDDRDNNNEFQIPVDVQNAAQDGALGFDGDVGEEQPGDEDDNEAQSDDEEVEQVEEVLEDYDTILKHLSKQWIDTEISHRVSKTASDAFWKLGKKWFHKLFQTKAAQGVRRKTPDFTQIRRRLYIEYVPPIKMDICYEDRENGALSIIQDTLVTPKSQFPPHRFTKVWEIGKVEVS